MKLRFRHWDIDAAGRKGNAAANSADSAGFASNAFPAILTYLVSELQEMKGLFRGEKR